MQIYPQGVGFRAGSQQRYFDIFRFELREKLNKLRLNQQRVWREYAIRGAKEVGTTASGFLFRRAKLLEQSGILEEEQEEERQMEAQMGVAAARKLLESREQLEREEKEVCLSSSASSNEEDFRCSGQTSDTMGLPENDRATWALTSFGDEMSESQKSGVRCSPAQNSAESETRKSSGKKPSKKAPRKSHSANHLQPTLRRIHTSPILLGNDVTKENKIKENGLSVSSPTTVKGAPSAKGKVFGGPREAQCRSSQESRRNHAKVQDEDFAATKTLAAIPRTISSISVRERRPPTVTTQRQLPLGVKSVRRPHSQPQHLSALSTTVLLKTPSPVPSSGDGSCSRITTELWCGQHNLKGDLYVPRAAKRERRIIVPDKKEMLCILEEQKRELQKRIDSFIVRQPRTNSFQMSI